MNKANFPQTIEQLLAILGKAIFVGYREMPPQTGGLIIAFPVQSEDQLVAIGRAWCATYRSQLGLLAELAAWSVEDSDPRTRFLQFFSKDTFGIRSFIEEHWPVFARPVLLRALNQDRRGVNNFLYLLQILPEA